MQDESGEVEEERFDGARVLEGEGAGFFGLQRVARRELHAADLDFAADQLEPEPPALTKLMRDRAGLRGLHTIDIGVLTDVRRALTSVIRNDEHLGRGELLGRRLPFGITRTETGAIGLDPDLDEMEPVGLRGVIFAVPHPAAGAHDLNLTGLELGVIAGSQTLNPYFSTLLPGADDGKVSVASTRVEGMKAHLTLPVTHTFMMNNPRVIAQTIEFLRNGRFVPELTLLDAVLEQIGCPEGGCLPGIEVPDAKP